jgi:hypothetical protein
MSRYPCSRCGAEADESAGCPACGAPPDPVAAELARLHRQLADLDRRDFTLRQEYAALIGQRERVRRRIDELWGRVPRGVPAGPPPAGTPVAGTSVAAPLMTVQRQPATSRPETSTRSVQTVLLVLGGVLLGIAAIVFTAVAWATFGVTGRAVILAGITTVTLVLPVPLRRRELTATAETVAALGLLLVLLDGYAAWTVDLAGVRTLPPAGYAALVFAVTAAVAAGYQPVSRLAVPWFAALLCAQPVLPLLADTADPSLVNYAAALAVTAAGNLAVLALLRRDPSGRRPLRFLTLALFLLTAALAGLLSVLTLALTDNLPQAVGAGAALTATAALGVIAASGTQRRPWRTLGAGLAAVAVVVAVARPVTLAVPGYGLLTATVVTVLVWTAALLVPGAWRVGSTVACAVTGALLALPAVVEAATGATSVLVAVPPVWHTDLAEWPDHVARPDIGWQPLAVLALLAVGSSLLTGPYRRTAGHHLAVAGLGLVALAAPAGLGLPWWSPVVIGTGLGTALAALAAAARGDGATSRAAARGVTGTVLLLHATAASLVRPGVTTAALAATAAGAVGVAALAARVGGQRVTGGISSAVAVALLPAATGSAGMALHWPQAAVVPAMVVAASVGLAATALLRFTGSGYLRYAVTGLSVATATTSLSVIATDQPVGVYAAVSGLIGVAAATLLPDRPAITAGTAVTAGLPFAVAAVHALPGMLSLAQPYLWLFQPWQGVGESTRDLLAPRSLLATFLLDPLTAGPWDPLTLALLTAGCGIVGYALGRRPAGSDRPDNSRRWALAAMLPGATLTVLVAPVGFDWRWPALPLTALALAVAAGLVAGLAPRDGSRSPLAPAVAVWPVAGSVGLANCLATRETTLVGLAVATVAGLAVALLGRTVPARVTGWVVAGTAAAALVETASLVAGLTPEQQGYGVLAVAVLLLGAAALLPSGRKPETLTVERLSFAAVGFAVLVAHDSLPTVATSFAGYGALLGLSALRPGRRRLALGGIGCELVAWWVFLWTEDVGLVEAYTVPFAVAALAGGVLELRRRPGLTSWQAYGLALAAMFLPSFAVIVSGGDPPLRRLGLGLAALVVVIAGAVRRRQAPVVVGGTVLALLAVRELIDLWELLPRWLPLAVAGLILLILGATYEQRRRDVRRLRASLGRMT